MKGSAKKILALILALIGGFPLIAQNIDYEFNPFIKSVPQVYNMSIMPDGKIVASGDIASAGNHKTPGMVRLNSDGTLDTVFLKNINWGKSGTY